ncbi:hypothetical protein [Chitinophaga pinensis]|uniref:Uncharacterized protein n=1 Tax=Chitinophaga pinensis (strain ATCC 43595 / DSM 2588 / LMG 13176 / NBRC 15968 / NCIMB 11800 / UQM 2034) TaxID=485918 RepID=A0A979G944_CHIPD|nr:hypothetical protein [Chitinophaga pinensis]ACU62986.1 hypothetical protein Cpin_5559 [Chitinophaga pinensis DSM 2588]
MKKTLSLAFFAALCAAGTAFAGKLQADTEWLLNDGSVVTGTSTEVKIIYCGAANTVQCAVSLTGPTTIIRKS